MEETQGISFVRINIIFIILGLKFRSLYLTVSVKFPVCELFWNILRLHDRRFYRIERNLLERTKYHYYFMRFKHEFT